MESRSGSPVAGEDGLLLSELPVKGLDIPDDTLRGQRPVGASPKPSSPADDADDRGPMRMPDSPGSAGFSPWQPDAEGPVSVVARAQRRRRPQSRESSGFRSHTHLPVHSRLQGSYKRLGGIVLGPDRSSSPPDASTGLNKLFPAARRPPLGVVRFRPDLDRLQQLSPIKCISRGRRQYDEYVEADELRVRRINHIKSLQEAKRKAAAKERAKSREQLRRRRALDEKHIRETKQHRLNNDATNLRKAMVGATLVARNKYLSNAHSRHRQRMHLASQRIEKQKELCRRKVAAARQRQQHAAEVARARARPTMVIATATGPIPISPLGGSGARAGWKQPTDPDYLRSSSVGRLMRSPRTGLARSRPSSRPSSRASGRVSNAHSRRVIRRTSRAAGSDGGDDEEWMGWDADGDSEVTSLLGGSLAGRPMTSAGTAMLQPHSLPRARAHPLVAYKINGASHPTTSALDVPL